MDIRSKWLRALFAVLMCASVGLIAGCAEGDAGDGDAMGESDGSDDIGSGGVDAP